MITGLLLYWWIYLPILLFWLTIETWKLYIRHKYIISLEWVLLEVKPPPDVPQSPKIAENIFAGLHGIYLPVTWKEQFFKGKVPNWFSFEIVGNGGGMDFYIRSPKGLRNLVESQIFAQYPDAEIKVVDDYITSLPKHLPNDDYDLFGMELSLAREDAYPIKTYPDFEESGAKDEFKNIDPIAPLAETMSSLEPGEQIWIQLLCRPTGGDWVKKASSVIDEIIGKKPKQEAGFIGKLIMATDSAIFPVTAKKDEKKEEKEPSVVQLSPGKKNVLERVENKISKLGFKSGIRYVYIARKEIFHWSHISAIMGTFKQLAVNDLNSFKPSPGTITAGVGWFSFLFPSAKGFFAAQETFRKKHLMYTKFRDRTFVSKLSILNTEELATIFHMPNIAVKAPAIPRVEAKKGQPPPILELR